MRDIGRVPLNAPEVEGVSAKPSPPGRASKASIASSYAGSVTCLRCDRCFHSWTVGKIACARVVGNTSVVSHQTKRVIRYRNAVTCREIHSS